MVVSNKKQQYRNLLYVGVGLVCMVCILTAVLVSSDPDAELGKVYKKEIKNGVDTLSDQDLWVERSTNEIEELKQSNKQIKDQNLLLQKQLETLQNLVVGIGKHLNIFKVDASSRSAIQENVINDLNKTNSTRSTHLLNSSSFPNTTNTENINNPKKVDPSLVMYEPMYKIKNFVGQRGNVAKIPNQVNQPMIQGTQNNKQVLRHGIKVFQVNQYPNEYDLDENFIFAGTYARAVLLGSVTVSAGISSSSNPKPVLLRIVDPGNLPNNVKGFLNNAVVIGAAYGNLAAESVVIRLERIIKIDKSKGVGIDIPVKGYVAGENGDSEIRGIVFDRAGAVARTAAVAGFLNGISNYITYSKSSVTFDPNSGLAQFSPQNGSKMLQQGASEGIGQAVSKYADFIIKRAEQMQPVIKIDGGRKVTIVFTESVKASAVNMKKVRRQLNETK